MADNDSGNSVPRNFQTGLSQGSSDDQFVMACDWGDNWGRVAMTSNSNGAEILIVIPFTCEPGLPAHEIERRIYDQARPQLSYAVRALIGKAWPQDS